MVLDYRFLIIAVFLTWVGGGDQQVWSEFHDLPNFTRKTGTGKRKQDSIPTRQFTDTVFEDSSPTLLKTVHLHF